MIIRKTVFVIANQRNKYYKFASFTEYIPFQTVRERISFVVSKYRATTFETVNHAVMTVKYLTEVFPGQLFVIEPHIKEEKCKKTRIWKSTK